jgi:hypothetical protein
MKKIKEWLQFKRQEKQFKTYLQIGNEIMSVTRLCDNKIFDSAEPVHVLNKTPRDGCVFYVKDFNEDHINVLIVEWDSDGSISSFNIEINHISPFNKAESDLWILAQKNKFVKDNKITK